MKKILEILKNFEESRNTESYHVDEFIDEKCLKSKKDIFFNSINVFNNFTLHSEDYALFTTQIDLQFELIHGRTIIRTVPKSIDSLIELVDEITVPEITIYEPKKNIWSPKLEMYFCPIPFDLGVVGPNVNILYEEYRTMDDYISNEEYVSWLTLSYLIE